MKKVLIIEDDSLIANVYQNKLAVDGYRVETAAEGEEGLELVGSFHPDIVLLDLTLPKMSGVEVIKQIRAGKKSAGLPIIVFSNIYMTSMIQEAWKAGATKCLSKTNCSPQNVLDLVRNTIGDSGALPRAQSAGSGTAHSSAPPSGRRIAGGDDTDAEFLAELRGTFIKSLPATLATLRTGLQNLIKSEGESARLQQIHEQYRRVHALAGNAGIAGLAQINRMSAAIEALLKELYETPRNINNSTLRTVATGIDFLGILFDKGIAPETQECPAANILVVDDEAISRRAVSYALDKAQLHSVAVEDPAAALNLLTEQHFDLVFLDVDMPGMTGFELCTKMRSMPRHKKTPVIFVTALSDFDNRTNSTMAGGNDFIAKPFLFIELTVKALIHVLRGKLQPAR